MAQFDLCPKCGAVARDGECTSCGYKIPGIYGKNKSQDNYYSVNENSQNGISSGSEDNQNSQSQQHLYNQTTWMQDESGRWIQINNNAPAPKAPGGISTVGIKTAVTMCIATMIVIVCAVAVGTRKFILNDNDKKPNVTPSVSISMDSKPIDKILDEDYLHQLGQYDGNLRDVLIDNADVFTEGAWMEVDEDDYDGGDPQAYEFDDCVNTNVSYRIEEDTWSYYNANGEYDSPEDDLYFPRGITMYSNYYRLCDTGLDNEDEINRLILKKSMEIGNMGEVAAILSNENEELTVICDTYVAYNDNDVISFLYNVTGYRVYSDYEDESYVGVMAEILSLNIDLHTGAVISAEKTFDFGGDFYQIFKEKCLSQNDVELDYYDDDELRAALTDDRDVVWAYTPLGIEVGVNRPGYSGWTTVTFTDYSEFLKVY